MTAKKKPEDVLPAGRKTKFDDTNFVKALELYQAGATDVEVAKKLKVTDRTINNWKIKFPAFFQSVKIAKEFNDQEVEQSLFKRAKGFVRKVQKVDKFGRIIESEEELPPDPTSMIFWLKNRKPKEWRDKQEFEHNVTVIPVINIGNKKEEWVLKT